MFRIKLSIAIVVLLFLVLLLAAGLYWGAHRAAYYSERNQLARDAAEAYLELSHSAYRHFKLKFRSSNLH